MSSNNIKIHYAGSHGDPNERYAALWAAGARRYLQTAYPYILKKDVDQIEKVEIPWLKFPWKHVIIDSGLFTLMFGSAKNTEKTPEMIKNWMHRLVKFMQVQQFDKDKVAVVEVDAQKVISPEFTWELRKEMRRLLPGQEIINVFHLEDGQDGFEKLCQFSDYIAISVPELRIAQPGRFQNTTCALARLARKIKPDIKIHLLGCTQKDLLKHNKFCTSADSTSWSAGAMYGTIDGIHTSRLKPESITKANKEIQYVMNKFGLPKRDITDKQKWFYAVNYYNALKCNKDYTEWCGDQN